MTDSQEQLLIHLLRQGDWSSAIAFYREETGRDTEAARLAVRKIAEQYGLRPRSRWAAPVAVAVVVATAGWFFWT